VQRIEDVDSAVALLALEPINARWFSGLKTQKHNRHEENIKFRSGVGKMIYKVKDNE
jgi:hypothetical protein